MATSLGGSGLPPTEEGRLRSHGGSADNFRRLWVPPLRTQQKLNPTLCGRSLWGPKNSARKESGQACASRSDRLGGGGLCHCEETDKVLQDQGLLSGSEIRGAPCWRWGPYWEGAPRISRRIWGAEVGPGASGRGSGLSKNLGAGWPMHSGGRKETRGHMSEARLCAVPGGTMMCPRPGQQWPPDLLPSHPPCPQSHEEAVHAAGPGGRGPNAPYHWPLRLAA